MRKIIIDTDTGPDEAGTIMMCLREPSIEVLALTTVSGCAETAFSVGLLSALHR